MGKSPHEEKKSQTLQTNKKQIRIVVTFLTAYNGIFKVTIKKIVSISQYRQQKMDSSK